MKTSKMNKGTRNQRATRSGNLAEQLDHNPRLVGKCAIQDEKDFMPEVPTIVQTNRAYFTERKIRYWTRISFTKQINNPSKWCYQLFRHVMGQSNHFLLMDVEQKGMHRHTKKIYRKNFYLSFNTFIYIKTRFLNYKIFNKKHVIFVLSNHMNCLSLLPSAPHPPPHYLIIIFRFFE